MERENGRVAQRKPAQVFLHSLPKKVCFAPSHSRRSIAVGFRPVHFSREDFTPKQYENQRGQLRRAELLKLMVPGGGIEPP